MRIIPVILAGGSGTRLWPASRRLSPKQFLNLIGGLSLFQRTIVRVEALEETSQPIVLCGSEHRFMVAEQLREISSSAVVIVEPAPRSTAPAVAVAAFVSEPDDVLLVFPSDHYFSDESAFLAELKIAIMEAKSGHLITLGITPSFPHTGYGYIEKGSRRTSSYVVKKFVEKPSQTVAKSYIEDGNYLWNSGIFAFRANIYLEQLAKFRPDVHEICKRIPSKIQAEKDFSWIDENLFSACPSVSIDVAVMEMTSLSRVIPLDAGWTDLGDWGALLEVLPKDQDGNSISDGVMASGIKDTLVRSEGGRLIATLGLQNLVIVDTEDALLVADKGCLDEVRDIVAGIELDGGSEHHTHQKVHRPWGVYENKDRGDNHLVKRIIVNGKASLSLQKHEHRAEHWIVVRGIAEVSRDGETFLLRPNESTYIPVGSVHSLKNPKDESLELIEVQTGAHLSESDIVRLSDDYGRA